MHEGYSFNTGFASASTAPFWQLAPPTWNDTTPSMTPRKPKKPRKAKKTKSKKLEPVTHEQSPAYLCKDPLCPTHR
jgi:hypothetical protein